MIRYYCQYSYGGFKVFRIKGEIHEPLNQEITAEQTYDLPSKANEYFNRGGIKLMYCYLDDNTIMLYIAEISGSGLSSNGEPINCAIQFIGESSDREQLDRLTIKLANKLQNFEKDFAEMFDLRGGLYFEGDRLKALVDECKEECEYEGDSELLQIKNRHDGCILFVPISKKYGNALYDSDFQIPDSKINKASILSSDELKKSQCRIEIKEIRKKEIVQTGTEIQKQVQEEKQNDTKTDEQQTNAILRKNVSELIHDKNDLICKNDNLNKENCNIKTENNRLKTKIKRIYMWGGGILALSLLSNILRFFF